MNEPNGINSKTCDCDTACSYKECGIASDDLVGNSDRMCRVGEELRRLFKVSRTLQESPSLGEIVAPVLKQMAESLGLYRGAVRILNRETREIVIDEAFGLSSEEMAASRIQLGEGVIGQVAKTGKPVIIPDLEEADQSVHPDCSGFNGQTIQRPGATAFLCVPIIHGSDVMGTLSGYRRGGEPHALEADQRLLVVTAQLIAQAARLRQTSRENLDALRLENERLQEQIRKHFKPDNMIGNSRAMQIVYNSIEQVAASSTTVLIRGESGVGKELVAHAIHMRSSRALKPLVKVNCAALPESIVESELFGHERGAFTGAIAMRKGRFELAHGGTIFLDEIGDLPFAMQAALLRVLQEHEITRLGDTRTRKVDVRVLAATHKNLIAESAAGRFREDLLFRLRVARIHIPPLRERKTDIPLLVEHFLRSASRQIGKAIDSLHADALQCLLVYDWPGNVRELRSCVDFALIYSKGAKIQVADLPPELRSLRAVCASPAAEFTGDRRQRMLQAVERAEGNRSRAAKLLGISRATFYRHWQELGLP